jgi:hypothetical protein
MPNIDEIVKEINPDMCDKLADNVKNIVQSDAVTQRIVNMFLSFSTVNHEILLFVLTGKPTWIVTILQASMSFAFEIGRLYGRSELIEELEKGAKEH